MSEDDVRFDEGETAEAAGAAADETVGSGISKRENNQPVSFARRIRGGLSKRMTRKAGIVVVVVVAVVVVAGAGFAVWHEQPSFCNAICHEPMDSYVDGYYADDTQMAERHRAVGVECLDCHVPTLGEQVSEAGAWVTGSYDNPLGKSNLANTEGFCFRSGCHSEDAWKDNHADVDVSLGDGCASCHVMHRSHVKWDGGNELN